MALAVLLSLISFTAARWCFAHGYTLNDGDAEAHLNIARRIFDSRTPGPEQIGTVWLPLPHILTIPFATRDAWWRSGIAGAIPSCICFVLAGTFLFAAARRVYGSATAALAVALLFALNPNVLYLQSTPMTEIVFSATLAALLWATLWYRDLQSLLALLAAAAASLAASLTRYEGWFLIPFVCFYLLFAAKNKWHAVLFGALASLAPLAWLAHNWFYYGNALEFYNGKWSALAIAGRNASPYPTAHHWLASIEYYFHAARLVAGWPLIVLAILGAVVAIFRRAWWPLALLALSPIFYIWSMHSGATPIYVPDLWPHSFYNTRYAIAALPLIAFAAGAIVLLFPRRTRLVPVIFLLVAPAAWMLATRQAPVCWKESEINSRARRAWTLEAARFMTARYQRGSGIIFSFGDLAGIFREAGIPVREGLHVGNGPAWDAALARPEFFMNEEWALAIEGDDLFSAIAKAGHLYALRERIAVTGSPAIEIYQRQ
ncbi:MAG: glycosyltransferase family 39 protein [Bryobacteraceae bacterium]